MLIKFILFLFCFSLGAETLGPFELTTEKTGDLRLYKGVMSKVIPRSIDVVRLATINFETRCNNEYFRKRMFQPREFKCTYSNENLIESKIFRDLKQPQSKVSGETERFVIARRVNNRGIYSHYELNIEKQEIKDKKRIITITQEMLTDEQVKIYLEKPELKNNNVFKTGKSIWVLTEISPKETRFDYEYFTDTDHWLLNKDISSGQVLSSMGKGLMDFWKSVETEALKNL